MLAVELDGELVAGRVLPNRYVVAEIRQSGSEHFRVFMRAAEIGTDSVLLLSVGRAQPRKTHQLGVHLGLLNDQRIAGCNGFDLGVGKRSRIQIFEAANRHVAAHHLGDELRFRLQGLPHVGVK